MKVKGKRGRQRTTWWRTVESERTETRFALWEKATNMVKDRNGLSKCILASYAEILVNFCSWGNFLPAR